MPHGTITKPEHRTQPDVRSGRPVMVLAMTSGGSEPFVATAVIAAGRPRTFLDVPTRPHPSPQSAVLT